jgi:hypothetical protein
MDTRCFSFGADSLPFHSFEGIKNSIHYDPLQKIELANSGREPLELDALRPTERIEKLFTIPVQTRLVGYMYSKHLPIRGRICYMIILRIICHEPLDPPKGGATSPVIQDRMQLVLILGLIEKLC